VHGDRLSDDKAICNELADGLAGVGIGNFADLIRIEPDLALSASYDGCREALLGGEVDPIARRRLVLILVDAKVNDASGPQSNRRYLRTESMHPDRHINGILEV